MGTPSDVTDHHHPDRFAPASLPADRSTELVDLTVGQLLRERASQFPERVALIGARHGSDTVERITYAQLYQEAGQVSTALSAETEPGDFVAVWAPNVVEWTIIQFGAALSGVVLVALNPVLRAADLDYALTQSGARILLHADRSRRYQMAEVAESVCAGIPGVRRISLSQFGAWLSAAASATRRETPTDPDAAVMLQYTSGTTGKPKGVLLTHRALVNVAKLTMQAAGVAEGETCFNPLPLFHTAGCVIATLGPLWMAGTAILCERFDPDSALQVLRDEQAGVLFYVPTVLHSLLHRQRESAVSAPQLRVVMGGAASVSAELIEGAATVFGAGVYNLYGQTELASVLTMTRPGDSADDLLDTVGRPLPQVDCKIADPETGAVVGIGEIGEIRARGYQQFVGYLHDPAATRNTLDAEGYVRTGDLGKMDARGYLTVTGRLKELIIRGGENISPLEVENVIIQHDEVVEVVAVGLPDERLGEIVAVACRVNSNVDPDLKTRLLAHAAARMPAYKVPARWFVVDQFPITPTGKIQRFALRGAALSKELHEL